MKNAHPLAAHAELELHIDPEELTNPWLAAVSSAVSFTIGALLPLIAILLPPASTRIAITVAAVLLALAITGWVAARLGGAKPLRPILRVTLGGALAMAITLRHRPSRRHDDWMNANGVANTHNYRSRQLLCA